MNELIGAGSLALPSEHVANGSSILEENRNAESFSRVKINEDRLFVGARSWPVFNECFA